MTDELPNADQVAIRTTVRNGMCYANLDDLMVWLSLQGDCDHLVKVLRDSAVLWRLEAT